MGTTGWKPSKAQPGRCCRTGAAKDGTPEPGPTSSSPSPAPATGTGNCSATGPTSRGDTAIYWFRSQDACFEAITADVFFHWLSGQSDGPDRKSTRLNSSHGYISYAVFFL